MAHGDRLAWRESLKAMYFDFFLLGRLSWGTFGALWLWRISQLMIPCAERADVEASGTFTDNSGVLVAAALSCTQQHWECEQSLFFLISPFLLHSLPASSPGKCVLTKYTWGQQSWLTERLWTMLTVQQLSWHSKTNSPHGFNETLGTSKTQRIKRHTFCLWLLALMFLQHCRHLSASSQNFLFCLYFCIPEDFKAFA